MVIETKQIAESDFEALRTSPSEGLIHTKALERETTTSQEYSHPELLASLHSLVKEWKAAFSRVGQSLLVEYDYDRVRVTAHTQTEDLIVDVSSGLWWYGVEGRPKLGIISWENTSDGGSVDNENRDLWPVAFAEAVAKARFESGIFLGLEPIPHRNGKRSDALCAITVLHKPSGEVIVFVAEKPKEYQAYPDVA